MIKREIIEWCETEEQLNEREIYWVAKLDAINEGLNISPGGDGGDLTINRSQEELKITAEKRSKSQKEAIKIYNETETKYISKDGKDILEWNFFLIPTDKMLKLDTTEHLYDK